MRTPFRSSRFRLIVKLQQFILISLVVNEIESKNNMPLPVNEIPSDDPDSCLIKIPGSRLG